MDIAQATWMVGSPAVGTRVVAIDVGSVRASSRFGWAAFNAPILDPVAGGDSPETALEALNDLDSNSGVLM
jgi:hypothetical protein